MTVLRYPGESARQAESRLRDELSHFPYLDEYDDPRPDPEPRPPLQPLPCVVCFKPYDLLTGGVCERCAPRWHGRLL